MDGKDYAVNNGMNIKFTLKSMNTLIFTNKENDYFYGDAIYENFPKLQDYVGMTELATLEIKNKDKVAGYFEVEVSLHLKPTFQL